MDNNSKALCLSSKKASRIPFPPAPNILLQSQRAFTSAKDKARYTSDNHSGGLCSEISLQGVTR